MAKVLKITSVVQTREDIKEQYRAVISAGKKDSGKAQRIAHYLLRNAMVSEFTVNEYQEGVVVELAKENLGWLTKKEWFSEVKQCIRRY